MRKIYSMLFLALFLTVQPFFIEQASACSCAEAPPVEESLKNNAAVFSGVVKAVKQTGTSMNNEVLIEVDEVWKGEVTSQTTVITASDSASCGFEFRGNVAFLVYANEQNENYHVNICDRTTLLSAADEDLAILGEGKPPIPFVEAPPERFPISFWFIGSVLLIGAIILVYQFTKNKKKL